MKKPVPTVQRQLPNIRDRRLYISTPTQQANERNKAEQRTQYNRSYWQKYKTRMGRVYGTIAITEYKTWEALAKACGRSVFGQIINDARAYRAGVIIAPKDILNAQDNMVGEIRSIGNNLNQLAKLGHIRANKHGGLTCDQDDDIGREVLLLLSKLENRVTFFEAIIPTFIQNFFRNGAKR